jgi:serine/threonine protein phosphatase PrpC
MSVALSWPPPFPVELEPVGRTDTGLVREGNEDAFALCPELGLVVVADGMGGHAAGEVASQMTVDAMLGVLLDPEGGWSPDLPLPPQAACAMLVTAIQRANAEVFAAARKSPALRGMGTTVVAALTFRGRLAVAHVGDSRAYLLRERWLVRLTEVHTVVNERRRTGSRPGDLDWLGGFSHALTRAVGSAGAIAVETRLVTPRAGDVVLLCSDGLTNAVCERDIAAVIDGSPDLKAAAAELIARANGAGGPDNVTVVLQRWS